MVAYTTSSAQTLRPRVRTHISARSTVSTAPEATPPNLRWRLLRWLIWGPALAVIVSACAVTGGIAFFLVPLLAIFYGFFVLIALQGPDEEVARREEERAKSRRP